MLKLVVESPGGNTGMVNNPPFYYMAYFMRRRIL
jgi:hypothetical protein